MLFWFKSFFSSGELLASSMSGICSISTYVCSLGRGKKSFLFFVKHQQFLGVIFFQEWAVRASWSDYSWCILKGWLLQGG